MKSKKVLGMVLSMALVVTAMAGCGASSESASKSDASQNASQKNTSENTAEKEQTTITFWHNYSAESKESKVLNETLIPRFEQEHPGFKVEAVSYSWEDLHNKIRYCMGPGVSEVRCVGAVGSGNVRFSNDK